MPLPPELLTNPLIYERHTGAQQSALTTLQATITPQPTTPSSVGARDNTNTHLTEQNKEMAGIPITFQKAIQTQVHLITSSTKNDKRDQEEEQQETKTSKRSGRDFENVLDPKHKYFEVFGRPFLDLVESTHNKSLTYFKYKEEDPMFQFMNQATSQGTEKETDMETEQDMETEEEETQRQKEKINNNIQISGKLFGRAIQQIKNN